MLHEHNGSTQGIRFVGDDLEGLSVAIHPVITPDERKRAIPREGDTVAKERTPDLPRKVASLSKEEEKGKPRNGISTYTGP